MGKQTQSPCLSAEQSKLVEDNHNIVYSVLNKYGWSIEEYYGVAAIGLCKAARSFKEEKGFTFSTFAYTAIKNEVFQELRKYTAQSRSGLVVVSLNEPIANASEEICLQDVLENTKDSPESSARVAEIKKAIKSLKPNERTGVVLTIAGYKQKEIAEVLNTTQANTSRIITKAQKRLEQYI